MRHRNGRRRLDHAPLARSRRARRRRRADAPRGAGLKRAAGLLALGLALSGLGCSKFQTARECGAFVEAIKAWKAKAPKAAPSAAVLPTSPAEASVESLVLADRYDDLATRIDALHLGSAELVPRAVKYQKLSREAAAALREVAAAVAKGDAEGARKRRVQFDDIASGEAALVTDINDICR